MERTVLLEALIGSLSYKLENGKLQSANREFECAGCEGTVDEGDEFYFITREKYCPECMEEAVEDAKTWLKELEAKPHEDEGNPREERGDGEDAGNAAGGDVEML